ncbi:MAG: hemerythrin domain-containing protein [Chloroflexi bacterium]|nr:hemerythrin domain-containing protein [Chloroflexota bacterium]
MKERLLGKISRIEATHPICVLMDEHERIEQKLAELRLLVLETDLSGASADTMERLKEVARLLLGAESHHRREEQVLFPRVQGRDELLGALKREHEELATLKRTLVGLVGGDCSASVAVTLSGLRQIAAVLVNTLREHIRKEEEMVYPAAVETLSLRAWRQVANEFEASGYCYFTARSAFLGCVRCMLNCPTRTLLLGDG